MHENFRGPPIVRVGVGGLAPPSPHTRSAPEVIMASRKLRHYFEAHRIIAISDQPLHDLLHNREASPRIAKWASELSELVVDFEKRTTIKSQVLADFIVDWTSPEAQEEELIETWTVYCDEA